MLACEQAKEACRSDAAIAFEADPFASAVNAGCGVFEGLVRNKIRAFAVVRLVFHRHRANLCDSGLGMTGSATLMLQCYINHSFLDV
jgi:hypothetical protein